MEISIIGGGIGGLATCAALGKIGINATVYERADELKEVGAGLSLWANATRVLKHFGLLDDVLSHGERIDYIEAKNKNGKLLKLIKVDHYEVPSVGIHRAALLDILKNAIAPERIKLSKTLHRYEKSGEKIIAHFADGTAVESDALIGADGLKSAVRAQMKGDDQPTFRGYTVFRGIADFSFSDYKRGHISESSAPGRRFGLLSIGGGRFYYFATHNQTEHQIVSPVNRQKRLLELFGDWHAPIPDIIKATTDDHILQNDCYDREAVPGWTDGRAVLIGDAAHPTTPNMGQGGCMALEDAAVLAKCLQQEPNPETAFLRFEDERFPRTKFIVENSRNFGRIGQWENPLAVGFRSLMMRLYPARMFEKEQQKVFGFEVKSK